VVADQPAFEKWFHKHRPEVIISKGAFVLPLLKKMGLRIPKDVAFVDVFLEKPDGTTAGVRQNHETVGGVAVEILAGQLQHNKYGVPEIPTTTYVEGTWFDGQTCPVLPGAAGSAPAR
jgi:LacI family transcriptional regulator